VRPASRRWGRVATLAALAWTLLAPVLARADELAFAVLRHAMPPALCADERAMVEVVLRNDGEVAWSTAAGDRVAYHWVDASGAEVVREGRRTALAEDVLPGRTTTLRVRVDAPAQAGRHTLVWAMVRDRVRWHAAPADGDATNRPVVDVVAGAPPLGFAIAIDAAVVTAGDAGRVPVRLTNTGCAAWSAGKGDALAYHWFDAEGREVVHEGRRTPLPDVGPGETIALEANVDGPPGPGAHVLVFEPVREPLAWFGEPTEGDARITVDVAAPSLGWSLVANQTPAHGFAGSSLRVRVAVRNDGTESWSDERGDRLSYHLHRMDGDGPAIEGVRTPWPHDIEPGEVVEVTATLELPPEPGRYAVVWEPVRERVRWFGPAGSRATASRDDAVIDVGPRQLAWSIASLEVPGRIWASRTTDLRAVVRNTGGDTWSPRTGDRLSFRWIADDGTPVGGDGMRTELPHDVAPGETVAIDVRVRATDEVGPARLQLGMVREHVAWFPEPDGGEASIRSVLVVRWGLLLTTAALVVLAIVGIAYGRDRPPPWLVVAWSPAACAAACLGFGELFVDLAHIEAWTGTRLGSMSAAAWIAAPLVLVPLRWQARLTVLVVVFACALSLVDLGYLAFFGSIVPTSAITAVHHLGDSHATVFSLWKDEYLLLAWPLATLVVMVGLRPHAIAIPWRARAAVFAGFVVAAGPALSAIAEVARSPIGERVFSERDNVGRLGLWNAHLFEAGRQIGRWIGVDALTDAQRREVDGFFAARVAERERPGQADHAIATEAPVDVIVIQVEAMQDWVLDAEAGGEPVMPFLAEAHGTAVRFTSIFDQTAQGRTSDAEYLALQSGHPLRTGALSFLRADNRFATIAHALGDRGWTTQSAHPYARGFWNRAAIHPRYGIATSHFREELGPGPIVGWGLGDVAFLERAAALVRAQASPSFSFFITLSLHHPYTEFPPQLAELDTSGIADPSLANYLQGMRHADRALAGFFAALHASGRSERSIVLVYGDHVTGLPWNDEALALAGVPRWDPTLPAREHRVGALLWLPDRSRTGIDDRIGGQIDLAPTLLDAAGVPAPASFVGRSLFRDGPRLVALPDGSAIGDDRFWLARGRDALSGGGCFDRDGRARDRKDCTDLAAAAADELWASRAVLDHDLYRALVQ
jgi:phosphoglycerol transferase MdoB-like AlkP superfamily enzyme